MLLSVLLLFSMLLFLLSVVLLLLHIFVVSFSIVTFAYACAFCWWVCCTLLCDCYVDGAVVVCIAVVVYVVTIRCSAIIICSIDFVDAVRGCVLFARVLATASYCRWYYG